MKKYLEILKKCPLFENIEENDLLQVLKCLGARIENFDKKYTVMSEGSPAKYLGVVISGSVQILQVDYYGNRSIVSVVGKHQIFGEAFSCAGIESMPLSVIANEPSEIMLIDCNRILHTCSQGCDFHNQLIFNLMRDLAKKTIMFHRKLEIMSKRTTREKLMAYIMLCAKKNGRSSFDIPFNRQELADYLEVDRSGLSAEIGKLKKEGIIDCNKNHFTIL